MPRELGMPMRRPGTDGLVSPGPTSTFSSVMVKLRRVSTKSPARALRPAKSDTHVHTKIKTRRIKPPACGYFRYWTEMSAPERGLNVQKLKAPFLQTPSTQVPCTQKLLASSQEMVMPLPS